MEGKQRFDDHIDKLLNYIRFWQSSGESLKTSIRTRARMEQLIQEHGFVGGVAPYGYQLCHLGRTNRRGQELYDLIIDPTAAQIVQDVFQQYCFDRIGSHSIAVSLNRQGHRTKQGALWNAASIRAILCNPIYTGIRTFGKIQTNRFAHLQIIEDDLFLLAQKRIEDSRLDSPNLGATKYRQEVLLPAEMFCMHCGKRMTVTRNVKTIIHQDGTRTTYPRLNYICINKSSLHPCTGQRSYSAKKIDPVVLSLLSMALFAEINSSPQPGLYKYEVQMTEIQKDIEREQENLDSLKTEVIAILQGSSAFGSDLINDLIQQTKSRLAALQEKQNVLQAAANHQRSQHARFIETRKRLLSAGITELSQLSLPQRQEFARQSIKRIELGRGGVIDIEWTFGGTSHYPDSAGE